MKTSLTTSSYKPICFNFGNQILLHDCKNYYRLVTMNQDLVVQHIVYCGQKYSALCGNSERIIGLYDGKLDIYNEKLEFLQTVGQTDNNSLPFYVDSSKIIEILLLNDNYILRHSNNVTIVNYNSGIQVTSIDIESHQIVTKDNKIYAIVSSKNNEYEVHVYDSNGELEYDYKLIGFKNDYLLSFNENKIDFLLNKTSLLMNK
jgi:hypothetical protein